jgi:hypothetical protein
VVIFRLNREINLPASLKNSLHGPYPPGAFGSLGNFSLNKQLFLYDNPILDFDPIKPTADRDNCFLGEIRSDNPAAHALDNIPLDHRVPIRLRPLTPRGTTAVLGTVYLRHPRMALARVHPDSATGYYNQVASHDALTELRKIGCQATVLDAP